MLAVPEVTVPPPLFSNARLRLATEADVSFFVEMAKERYDENRKRRAEEGVDWLRWAIKAPTALVLVGPSTGGVASINLRYGFEKKARLDMLVAKAGRNAALEAFQMVKTMVRWATLNGAEGAFRIDADTGVDFGPFARRLGGIEVDPRKYPRYDIPLDGGVL